MIVLFDILIPIKKYLTEGFVAKRLLPRAVTISGGRDGGKERVTALERAAVTVGSNIERLVLGAVL